MKKKGIIVIAACVLLLAALAAILLSRRPSGKEADVILEEPPALTVVSGQTNMDALLGSYSWQVTNPDGTTLNTDADSAHPLNCQKLLTPYETATATVTLQFAEAPDAILSVRCWSDEHWDDPTAASEDVAFRQAKFKLNPGGYIYEITAEWSTKTYSGTASYMIYLNKTE